ncbi:unnamed protein product, partial [Vitrella brassicaformis CCMP3155]
MVHRCRSGDQHPVPAPAPAIRTDEQDEDREFLGTFPVMPSHPGPSHDDSTPLAAMAPASASDALPLPPSLPSPTHHPAAAEAVYTHPPQTQLMQQMAGLTDEGWQMLRHMPLPRQTAPLHRRRTHHRHCLLGRRTMVPPLPHPPSHPVMTGSSTTDGGTSSRERGPSGQHEGAGEWQRPDEGDDEEDDWAGYDWGAYQARQRQHLRVANTRLRKELRRARGKTAVCESRVEGLRRLLVAYEHEHEDQEADSQLCATLLTELNKVKDQLARLQDESALHQELEAARSELTTARREHQKELMEVKYELWGLEEAHRDLNAAMEQATR